MKMKTYINSKITMLFVLVLATVVSCERDISEEASEVGFTNDPEIFIDGFSSGLEYYPFGGSDNDAFTVDTEDTYSGSASMRFDVPNYGDSDGSYAGAIFRDDNGGRDLSGYDALTFWAKSSQAGTINEIGFGQDFDENKFLVTLSGLNLATNWKKYIIAIPDASKLTQESGLFWYAEGPENNNGYTFWIDELQFEKLGTIAQYRPSILGGEDIVVNTFSGVDLPITSMQNTVNLSTGADQTVTIAPSYFNFTSSDTSVATVSELGVVSVIGAGTAVVSATSNDVDALGSLTITSEGQFTAAPIPTQNPENVISIFSDTYTSEPVDYYNGYWAPYQTTLGQNDINVNGDEIIKYSELNFVGIQFSEDVPTIDVSQMTHFHVDIQVQGAVEAGDFLTVKLQDIGVDDDFGGENDTAGEITLTNTTLSDGNWVSIDVPISEFTGLTSRANLAQVVFVSDATITDIYVDNIYFYEISSEPTTAAPTPTIDEANVISVFSDAYTNVAGSELNPNWGQNTVVTEESIAGNNILKYTDLNYQGLQLGSTQDVSGMTYLHLDYYTVNSSALNAYLISDGPVEAAKALAAPTSGWVTLDIPLADFSPVDLANIIQLKFDGNGDVYLDNIYFYN
ncbi:hypothetical protein H7F37_14875 [Winogradskyella sp. PAMC22761]|nr:hypothetical protein H7F37_14875 [Winogradskyella sp. PAMC22761]